MSWPRLGIVVRWIVAVILALAGARLLIVTMTHENGMGDVVLKILAGVALVITASLFVGPEMVRLAVAPINYVLDSILLPSETITPPVDYKLARFYFEQMRYEEACEEYFKILQYHPHEVSAYLEGIEAATAADQPKIAHRFHRMAMRKLSTRNGDRERFVQGITEGYLAETTTEADALPDEVTPPSTFEG